MIRLSSISRALALGALLLAGFAVEASGQVKVDLAFRRSLYIRYEPIIATITITNLSGREIELADDGNYKWLSFNIEHVADNGDAVPVAPYNPDYTLDPITIGPGEAIKRQMNVTPLYPLTEFGIYRVRASVFDRRLKRYFSSSPLNIEVTEGRLLWSQMVGVPEGDPGGGATRTISLLSHRLPDNTQLYVRIEDKDNGRIFCTHQIGKYISFTKPEIEVDALNQVHVLQNVTPKVFLYTRIGLDGAILDRKQYASTENNRPSLRRDSAGGFQVVGGTFIDPAAIAAEQKANPPPTINDRPVPLPKSE